MTAPKKGWNAVAVTSKIDDEAEQFQRETEVQVKLVVKPSREYIYELLTKTRFPLTKIEAITERGGNTVDFTCKDRRSADNLQRLLEEHPNVREARLLESEFIDVKLTGVPHRLPDGKLIAFLAKRNGEVVSTFSWCYYDGFTKCVPLTCKKPNPAAHTSLRMQYKNRLLRTTNPTLPMQKVWPHEK